jgi:uncharacterized heparinase superfamily protein
LRLLDDWRRIFGKWNGFSWAPECLERRVFHLACAAKALSAEGSDAEIADLCMDLARQGRHLVQITQPPSGPWSAPPPPPSPAASWPASPARR